MQIKLTPAEEAEIRRQASAVGYKDPGRYLVDVVINPSDALVPMTDAELKASLAMCDRSMAEIDAGLGMTLEEAREKLRVSLREKSG
ncbi:MAG: hypothetical protein AAF266_12075 [Planctomycetota bacterium]